jgi:hypothetical protein
MVANLVSVSNDNAIIARRDYAIANGVGFDMAYADRLFRRFPASAPRSRFSPAPESALPIVQRIICGTTGKSGLRRRKAKDRRSFSLRRNRKMDQMSKTILLIEDNPDDVKLTLRAFKRNNMLNPIVVARDGVEALDFLFAPGAYAESAGKR